MSKSNPLLFPDFSDRTPATLAHNIERELTNYRAEVEAIKSVPEEEVNFENTILALENAGKGLDLASATFFNLLSCDADDELMKYSEEITEKLSELNNEVGFDPILARHTLMVYESKADYEALAPIDQRLTYRTMLGFKRRGAYLDNYKQEELKQVSSDLSLATLLFGQNLLKEQREYSLSIIDDKVLSRLPQSALESAKQKAVERGVSGFLFDFSMPSYSALMKFCSSREIREKIYRDKGKLCFTPSKSTSNTALVYRIVELRHKKARLLGYDTYATYVLEEKMAKSPERVLGMLDELKEAYLGLAKKEMEQLAVYAKEKDGVEELMPWDLSYYAELYRQEYMEYDEEETRPYFELGSVVEAMLGLASDLYELKFERNTELLPYRAEVEVYNVSSHGTHVGTLMMDYFPRKQKRSGAWMTNYVEAYGNVRPVVSLVMNFTPPTSSAPSLLTIDEVRTLFHEFGHGLHGLLTQVPYASLSGTNVLHDFVELPSHFHENWTEQPVFIKSFAKHYLTGEVIGDELLAAIRKSRLFLEGYSCIRQLNFGYLDMKWHNTPYEALPSNIEELEKEVVMPIQLLPTVEGTCTSTAFSHLFSGGYAAGYYGYKWSEILEADAFEEFLKNGITDHTTSMRFKKEILEKGDAEDPDQLYLNFKGREPSVEALKRRSGLIP